MNWILFGCEKGKLHKCSKCSTITTLIDELNIIWVWEGKTAGECSTFTIISDECLAVVFDDHG